MTDAAHLCDLRRKKEAPPSERPCLVRFYSENRRKGQKVDEFEKYRYEQARAWLDHVKGLQRACEHSGDLIRVFERIADAVKGIDYTSEHVSGTPTARGIEDALARLDDLRTQYEADRTEYGAEAADAASRLSGLVDKDECRALIKHYCDGQEWADVARDMHFSEARIYEIRRSGVLAAYGVMPPEWRDRIPRADG